VIVNVADLSGPGIDEFVLKHLADWHIETLTDIQSKAVQSGVAAGNSMIVSAPTSSGKTLIGEIAILSALRSGSRAIYLVSHRALADQKYVDFVARFGERSADPLASVGLDTGDRSEGDIDAQLVVATYEKAFGLILTGQLKPENALVVADELQILGDPSRGPEIETLCAIFRQRGLKQFVALTATVENAADLAGWMRCDLVYSSHRDVPLHQEIWYEDSVYRTTFGHDTGSPINDRAASSTEVMNVVGRLLKLNCGPVLVFTESRGEAMRYAEEFGKSRPRASEGLVLAEQLDLFSEPTESSEQLRGTARVNTFETPGSIIY
jgi:helicase